MEGKGCGTESGRNEKMNGLTINQLKNAQFHVSEESPVLRPFDGSFVVADPSLLTPANSPDGKWHMFFHTNFGVYHTSGFDGVSFEKPVKITGRSMRPNINRIDGRYVLFYERTRPLVMNALNIVKLAKWKSEIYVTESTDLKKWSEHKPVITNTRDYEKDGHGISISNPFLLQSDGINRLYYSCGQTFIDDCGFCEPTYISYAQSKRVTNGYYSAKEPIIKPDKSFLYTNLCSGCLKVYRLSDGYIGIQNGIYEKDGKSHSAIIMLTSDDGINFEFCRVVLEPAMHNGSDWMNQFVYASHLVRYENTLRLYFNARDTSNMLKGRECIGFAEAEISEK